MEIFVNKKIIITGGAGFIGSYLVKKLVELGSNVYVLDNLWRGNINNLQNITNFDINKNFIQVDLTDYDKCKEYIKNCDIVYHLADIVGGIDYVFSNEHFVFRENILINTNVLSACIENNIKNYIYVGTACSYPKELQSADYNIITSLKEEQTYPANPESSYGWSKLMGEYEAELAQKSKKINVGLLRFHNVYGPGMSYTDKPQVLPSLCRKIIKNEPYIVYGSGNQYRDFIYIDDVIDALLLIFTKGLNKGLIQIGTGQATNIKEAAFYISELGKKYLNRDVTPIFDINYPEGDIGRISINDRANNILFWKPKIFFKEGIEKLFKYIIDN